MYPSTLLEYLMTKRSIKKERNIRITLPEDVKFIISELNKAGFEGYAVGGCVRDSLLKRTPGDWDITTSALPDDIKSIFRRTVDTGIEHGTVTVLLHDSSYEVTTYRIDGEYKDGRHPVNVQFTEQIGEDLRRRDFTINAMAYNDEDGLIDLFSGRDDLKRGIIRCVGNADERFSEDALRILRAVRFAAQLDFDIDAATRDAISTHAPNLRAVSKERILVEVSKLICSAHIERTADIFQLGIVPYIAKHFREINIAQLAELKRDAIPAQDAALNLNAAADLGRRYIRFALLAEGMEPEHLDEMLRDLKADNATRKNAVTLSKHILKTILSDAVEIKRVMSGMEPELFAELLMIKFISRDTTLYKKQCPDEDILRIMDICRRIDEHDEPVYLNELAVSGDDIRAAGMAEGPEIGRLLHRMQEEVWAEPSHNTRDFLMSYAEQ